MVVHSASFSANRTEITYEMLGATIAGLGSGRGHRAGDGAGDGPRRGRGDHRVPRLLCKTATALGPHVSSSTGEAEYVPVNMLGLT